MNHLGITSTRVPWGATMEHTYFSGYLATFNTCLFTDLNFDSFDRVIDGRFKSEVEVWWEVLHAFPVTDLTFDGSRFGREHKKFI